MTPSSVSIRRIADDEPDTPTPPVTPPLPAIFEDPREAAWKAAIKRWFGPKADAVLAITRCPACQGRMRPYVEPRDGARAMRDYGVKPGLRCARCGRTA